MVVIRQQLWFFSDFGVSTICSCVLVVFLYFLYAGFSQQLVLKLMVGNTWETCWEWKYWV